MSIPSSPRLLDSDDESPIFGGLMRSPESSIEDYVDSLFSEDIYSSDEQEEQMVSTHYYVQQDRHVGHDEEELGVVEVRKRKFISDMTINERKQLKKEYNQRAKKTLKERNALSKKQAIEAVIKIKNSLYAVQVGLLRRDELDVVAINTLTEHAIQMINYIKFN